MKIVQKGNKQLKVEDIRLEAMLNAGYVEIDKKTGKPVVDPSKDKDDVKALKKENAELRKENKALKEQIAAQTAAGE